MESSGAMDNLPKKEVIRLRHEREKLERNLGGIQALERCPTPCSWSTRRRSRSR